MAKTELMQIRITGKDQALIDRAAKSLDVSRSEWVREVAVTEASRIIARQLVADDE